MEQKSEVENGSKAIKREGVEKGKGEGERGHAGVLPVKMFLFV